jgi:hypothetical protein
MTQKRRRYTTREKTKDVNFAKGEALKSENSRLCTVTKDRIPKRGAMRTPKPAEVGGS